MKLGLVQCNTIKARILQLPILASIDAESVQVKRGEMQEARQGSPSALVPVTPSVVPANRISKNAMGGGPCLIVTTQPRWP